MKAKFYRSWTLNSELSGMLTTAGTLAVALATYHHKGYVLGADQPEPVELAAYSPLFNQAGTGFDPIDLDYRGALFAWHGEWGAVYNDVVHLVTGGGDAIRSLPVANPLPPDVSGRHQSPLMACALPGGQEIAVVMSRFDNAHASENLAVLRLEENDARWQSLPAPLHAGDFPPLTDMDSTTFGNSYSPFVTAIGADEADAFLIHSPGPNKNYHRYGMSFSVLARVNRDLQSRVVAAVEKGWGTFASDGESFLLYRLGGKPMIDIHDRKGNLKHSVSLTPGILGGRKRFNWTPILDLRGDDLWIADPFDGYVCHIRLG